LQGNRPCPACTALPRGRALRGTVNKANLLSCRQDFREQRFTFPATEPQERTRTGRARRGATKDKRWGWGPPLRSMHCTSGAVQRACPSASTSSLMGRKVVGCFVQRHQDQDQGHAPMPSPLSSRGGRAGQIHTTRDPVRKMPPRSDRRRGGGGLPLCA
jgi:hypothetical protein